MECPVCKLDLHPAMAQRYSGTCSQGCEAIAENGKLEEQLKQKDERIKELEITEYKLKGAFDNAKASRNRHKEKAERLEKELSDAQSCVAKMEHEANNRSMINSRRFRDE